jgi:NAD+ synthase (glutamine-hydrolysing)
VPVVYVNQTGATDEILFDGASFVTDAQGNIVGRLAVFRPAFGVVNWEGERVHWVLPDEAGREDEAPEDIEVLSRALVVGIREYFARTGFKKAILGLSGGIDSAVVATLAARALGAENVTGVAMPSQYSSPHSLEDAERLARNLGIRFEVRPIKFAFAHLAREWGEGRGGLAPIAQENLQSRLRGMMLMTYSNHDGSLLLTTGNKSELAMGYCTLYGDMSGALAPIGDLFKTRVISLARYLNSKWGNPIPERTLTKPPSAELKPDQRDDDTLPPYEKLDPLLKAYLEDLESRTKLRQQGAWVEPVLKLVEQSEFKRRQAPPVLKVSAKAFGIGRRVPVAKFDWQS